MILDELVTATHNRLERQREKVSLPKLKQEVAKLNATAKPDFLAVLQRPGIHVIAEVKKASPSKGTIVTDFPYLQVARTYEQAGADAISVLTEPDYFKGKLRYLNEISAATSIPTLRKDFTIDPYMVYEAKLNGAAIILLIVAILTDEQLCNLRKLAEGLGMQAIVEAYTETEVTRAVRSGAKIIGINNRNLKNFAVDFGHSFKMRSLVPAKIPVIAESGISGPTDVKRLAQADFKGVLVGEALMKATNKREMIRAFKEF
ncbi:MAG: indole-3-glycerol phosphate synthase TrpC [Liquorilactobacillus satsumensis]|uniref:indole-3-glycerol phosphate synthase TrpC n=1 Tax=Liquorilactobacillus satsumensis TaxID=259059 RepID=UPI0039ECE216